MFQHKDKKAPVACKESFVLVAVLLSAKARDRICVSDIQSIHEGYVRGQPCWSAVGGLLVS